MDEIVRHPQLLARQMIAEVDSPIGPVQQIGVAPKLSETPGRAAHSGPLLGGDTETILRELGYDGSRIARLRAQRAIYP